MRRIGKKTNIIEEIVSEVNLRESIARVMRGKKRRRTREGRWIMSHQDEVVRILRERISSGEFCVTAIGEMMVDDGPKVRHVQYCKKRVEAIGLHAIMRVVEAKVHNRLVKTTAASIKGRGMHYLLKKIQHDIENDPDGMRFAYKYDFRKCYESIDQDIMMWCLRRMFRPQIAYHAGTICPRSPERSEHRLPFFAGLRKYAHFNVCRSLHERPARP